MHNGDEMKPVAWIDYLEDSNLYDLNVSGRGVPLYTAPKELSDEEILEVCLDGGYVDCIADVDLEIDGLEELKHQYLRLCRAILKKASEK